MFSESFDEIIRAGDLPCPQQMLLCLLRLFQAHMIHHCDQMQIDGGYRITSCSHGKCCFYDTGTASIFLFQIEVV